MSSGSYSATLEFADTEHSVMTLNQLFDARDIPGGNASLPGGIAAAVHSNKYAYFGELEMEERSGTDLDLSFRVEGQPDRSKYRHCRRGVSTCQEVEIRVLPDKGLLYFWHPGDIRHNTHRPAAFPHQRLEVSASEADTGLKVYREVLVNPPPEVKGCEEDYGDDTVEAYVCLYVRELIPDRAGSSNEATLRANLPGLVQDASNYELVFAEEFDGTPPAANSAGCRDGLSTLDDDLWNHGHGCGWVDSRGEPCTNVVDGKLVIAVAYKCGANVNTFGKLHYQYGYLEYKYTVNVDAWNANYNYNLIAWAPHNSRQHLWSQYGVTINSWEDFARYGDIEIDYTEYVPGVRHDTAIVHANWDYSSVSSLPAIRSVKWLWLCSHHYPRASRNWFVNPNRETCRATDTFTVTKGMEWTPRGYRTFTKVDGFHDDLTLWPRDMIEIWTTDRRTRDSILSESEEARYFAYVDSDDTSTILEQIGIAHTPNPIAIGAWGYWSPGQHYIRSRMKIDYIRLWQPEDHYSGMEPVYQ